MTLATKLWSPKWWLVDGWWFDLDPASGWWMDSTTEAANKILSSAQTREKCLKIFQCRIVASRARFWDIQRLIQRVSKNSKKKHNVLMEPRITKNSVNHDISWCIITNPMFFPRYASRLVAYVLLRPNLKFWLRLAAFVRTRDHCRWQLQGFRCGSFSIDLRLAELCQSKFMRFTIDLPSIKSYKSSCHEQIHDFLLKPESTHWWVHQDIFASQFRSCAEANTLRRSQRTCPQRGVSSNFLGIWHCELELPELETRSRLNRCEDIWIYLFRLFVGNKRHCQKKRMHLTKAGLFLQTFV